MAAEEGHEAVCRLLLQRGADVNAKVGPGFRPLMAAVDLGKTTIVRLLLDAGADPNTTRDFLAGKDGAREKPPGGVQRSGANEMTCLMVAASLGHADICRILTEHGAIVDARGLYELTALGLAANRGRGDACRTLLENKADPNLRDVEGATPLILAAHEGHMEVCRVLLDGGADVNAADAAGRTALSIAMARGDTNTGMLLTIHGADFPDEQPGPNSQCPAAVPAFCSGCGNPLTGAAAFCARCGRAAAPLPPRSVRTPASAPASLPFIGGLSSTDYSRVFAQFEAAGGKWVPTFNLLAFLIGPIWYLLKGMWPKAIGLALASIVLITLTGGVAAILPWLYYGFFGNWDLYLFERQGKQGW